MVAYRQKRYTAHNTADAIVNAERLVRIAHTHIESSIDINVRLPSQPGSDVSQGRRRLRRAPPQAHAQAGSPLDGAVDGVANHGFVADEGHPI